MAKVRLMIRLLLIPTRALMTLSWAVARMALPMRVLKTRIFRKISRAIVMSTIMI